ncbi:hypothetical protein E2C01_102636 [Portunus trituberculatus]|uniref:Ionotropic glutamate receptor C-terminal domain-containing protein n=1 Tax=Portunus trituberculatus TaxID=210409 RepID=A0A5B7KN19_PORTR|nr:hypothetical protein [Portunus trituberculatus]
MPSKDLGRSVAALWLLMAFTLGSVYRSNLKAMIIYPRIHLPFSTLDELQRTDISAVIFNGSEIHKHIKDRHGTVGPRPCIPQTHGFESWSQSEYRTGVTVPQRVDFQKEDLPKKNNLKMPPLAYKFP